MSLYELFAECDVVFTEYPPKLTGDKDKDLKGFQISLGRIYKSYKKTKKELEKEAER